jgi:hypothetical protein
MEVLMFKGKRKWLCCALLIMAAAFVPWTASAQKKDSIQNPESGPSVIRTPVPVSKVLQKKEPLPDLYVTEFSLSPSPPSKEAVVDVHIGVFNQGSEDAGAFTVEWWPGENYQTPGCTWRIESLKRRGGRILKCSGYVFPSKYAKITTVVKIDPASEINESDKNNNLLKQEIQVLE